MMSREAVRQNPDAGGAFLGCAVKPADPAKVARIESNCAPFKRAALNHPQQRTNICLRLKPRVTIEDHCCPVKRDGSKKS